MISNALDFLLSTLLGLYTLALLLRFYLQLTGAPFQNPFSQAMVALTNPLILPLRKVIPGWRGLDISSLFAAFLVQCLLALALLLLRDFPIGLAGGTVWVVVLLEALLGVIKTSVDVFIYAIIVQAILSWVNPYNLMTPVLDALTRPVLRPIRKRLPLVGGNLDLSPLVALILLQLLIIVFVMPLEQQLKHWLI